MNSTRQLPGNDLENRYVLTTLQTILYVDQNPDAVWPNYNISRTPTIIHFPDTQHIYAFDFLPENPAWQKLTVAKPKASTQLNIRQENIRNATRMFRN